MWLPELAAYYYKARIYSPSLGRFLQPDPIGYWDTTNLYAYVRNDPINWRDPSGQCPPGEFRVVDLRYSHRSQTDPSGDIVVTGPPRQEVNLDSNQADPALRGGKREIKKPTQPQKPKQTFAQCALAAAKKNAGVLALDALSVAASFVPGGKGLVTAGAAVVGSFTGAAAFGIGVAHRDVPGAAIGAAGHYVSTGAALLEGAKGLARNLPVAGQALAIGGAVYDTYNALKEGGCLGGTE